MRLFVVLAEMVIHTGDCTSEARGIPSFLVEAADEAEAQSKAGKVIEAAATAPNSYTMYVRPY